MIGAQISVFSTLPTTNRYPPSPNSEVDMKAGEYGGKKGKEGKSIGPESETRRAKWAGKEDPWKPT